MDIIALLKAERDKAAQQVNALDTAIRALSGLDSAGGSRHGPRTMSAAARARISASQKHVGHAHGARRLSPSLPSVTSQRQDQRISERQLRRDGRRYVLEGNEHQLYNALA